MNANNSHLALVLGSVVIFACAIWFGAYQKHEKEKRDRLLDAQAAASTWSKMEAARNKRDLFFKVCIASGDVPLLLMDNVVCVKKEAVVWVKYDEYPQKTTTE